MNAKAIKDMFELFTTDEIDTYKYTTFTSFLQDNSDKYKVYDDNWYKLGDSAMVKDVLCVRPIYRYGETMDDVKTKRFKDEGAKRKAIYTAASKIKVINPDVTKEEMLYNMVYFMYHYTTYGRTPFTWFELLCIATAGMNTDIEAFKAKRIEKLGDKAEMVITNPYTIGRTILPRETKKQEEKPTIEEQDIPFDTIKPGVKFEWPRNTTEVKKKRATKEEDTYNKELVRKYFDIGKSGKEISKLTNISLSKVYKLINQIKEEEMDKILNIHVREVNIKE